MASLNSCSFIGNLGRDAELRYGASGTAQSSFSIGVNNRRRGTSGEWEDNTEWVNCVMFGDMAERVSQYLVKGKPVYVSGRLQTRTWKDDAGQTHYRTEIIVNELQLLGSRDGGNE